MPPEDVLIQLVALSKKLEGEISRIEKLFSDPNQLPMIQDLQSQIQALRDNQDKRERFFATYQQQVIKQIVDLLKGSGALDGPAYRRLKPKIDNLERFISTPDNYVKEK